jgi:hypothetical protein
MKKTNAAAKSAELKLVLNSHFKGKVNQARAKIYRGKVTWLEPCQGYFLGSYIVIMDLNNRCSL